MSIGAAMRVIFVVFVPVAYVSAAEPAFKIGKPPAGKFDEKYTKYVNVDGFPVLGTDKVNDYALREGAYIVQNMLAPRPDVRKALIQGKCHLVVMAVDEFTTDVPEHSDLKPKAYWDRRARGLGATKWRPAVSCGEENLLCYPGDPYFRENILIHEFAHAFHLMGLTQVDPKFNQRLKTTYEKAMADELWKGKYVAQSDEEYWAEGVQCYFDANAADDADHNHVRTREALKQYDRQLFDLINEVFRETSWRYVRPPERKEMGHLAGYDPKTAKRFQWPKGLERLPPKE
jgi:hypothetical protein